jgi:predicted RNA-binding protein YlqC (UPF0109 family)
MVERLVDWMVEKLVSYLVVDLVDSKDLLSVAMKVERKVDL